MQDVGGAVLDQLSPVAQVGPQADHLGIGPEGAGEET
jgi:hypothetical protein